MKFKRFNSIDNTYRTKTVNVIVEQGKSTGKWVVEEKVHGANFSFWYDGVDMKNAKRSAFVIEGENFFNSNVVDEKYRENVISLFEHLKETIDNFHSVVVFGELYGGNYPHKDVENDNTVAAVQNGLFYNPNIDFYAFDIKVNVNDPNDDRDNYFLNVDVTNELFEKFGFFYARPLFVGTFEECIDYENAYVSKLPEWLGLPAIEDNICEGNVLKPMEASYFWNGSRVVLKNKNEKFSEKKNNKPKIRKVVNLSDEANDLMAIGLMFITENRLRNVLSKFGPVSNKGFGAVMGMMNKDAIEDFLVDNKERFAALSKKEAKVVTKRMGQENANLLRANFLNIIDGEF